MSLKNVLKNIPLFKTLKEDELEMISDRLHRASYPKGTIIFREGAIGDSMYLVESGQLAVLDHSVEGAIAFMGPGTFVGEISLLLAQPRTATLQVTIDAQLWVLSKTDFDTLIATRPAIAVAMLREVSQRLVTTTRQKRRQARRRITALIGGSSVLELAQCLFTQLRSPVGLLPLPHARMDGTATISGGVMFLGQSTWTEASLAESLSHQIQVFKHVLVLLPDQPDPLTAKAIDLADTIVSIGPAPGWLQAAASGKPVWTARQTPDDLCRLARRLTGQSVGLALSSGGSRGLAHLGVFKVLQAENIPIDMVAGTSAGAWFGAFFAIGWTAKRYDQFAEQIKTFNRFPNWDFNLPPRTALLKGRKARDNVIARTVEGRTFADLPIPLYIVAADILTGDEVVFDSGPLADAIRASLSIPILVDPWHHQDRYLVDGGIVNPLPASVLRDRGADIVIASSVIQPLAQSYSGRKDQIPNALQVIFNIYSAMEAEVIKKQLPLIDVLIHSGVAAKHSMDFDQAAALVRLGEESARMMVRAIREAIQAPPD